MKIGSENEFIEFKETLAEKEEAMKDIGAILNKRGAGTLFFGVKNDGEVIGLVVGPKTESDIASKINSSIEPPPFYTIETKSDPMGKRFIEVSFQGGERPYRTKGAYYIRNAEESDPMSPQLLSEMILQVQRSYDRWESAPSDCVMSDIDESLVRQIIETGNKLNRLNYKYETLEAALKFLHLLAPNGAVNNAGKVLFSSQKPITFRLSHLLDAKGKNYLDMQHASGNIFESINIAYDYILSKLDYSPVFSGAIQREMKPEIPALAIRELVVNAFGHAYYGAPTTQDFAIYPNRIAIFNPGPFPIGITPEEFASKEAKPVDKNDRINNVLYFGNYIEHFGTGFTKAFDLFAQEKISYRYKNKAGGFLFETFRPGKIYLDEEGNDYRKVLDYLTQNRYGSLDEIAVAIGKSKATASRIIASLKEDQKIKREGSDKEGYYVVL